MTRTRRASDKFLSGEDMKTFRMSRRLTQKELGVWLGFSASNIARYEVRGAPKSIALALSAIDRGLKPYQPTDEDRASLDLASRSENAGE